MFDSWSAQLGGSSESGQAKDVQAPQGQRPGLRLARFPLTPRVRSNVCAIPGIRTLSLINVPCLKAKHLCSVSKKDTAHVFSVMGCVCSLEF